MFVRSGAKRASFLHAAGCAAVATAYAVPVRAAEYNFKIANNTAVESPRSVRLAQMTKAIEKESNGRIRMQFFPNNQLGGDSAMFSQLRLGALQFLQLDSALMQGVVPAAAIPAMGCVFKTADEAFRAMDGPLGEYVRKEIAAHDMYAMPVMWDSAMRQITTATHPIKTLDDLQGFKIRTPAAKIWVELFKALGANPTPIEGAELYTALQTKIVDGQDASVITDEVFKVYEVQKYLSMTNHMWAGTWNLANGTVWKSLPSDLQGIIERNSVKFGRLQRRDMEALSVSLVDKLARRGMMVNTTDTTTFRPRLSAYYRAWKTEFGPTEWGLLESAVGARLG